MALLDIRQKLGLPQRALGGQNLVHQEPSGVSKDRFGSRRSRDEVLHKVRCFRIIRWFGQKTRKERDEQFLDPAPPAGSDDFLVDTSVEDQFIFVPWKR